MYQEKGCKFIRSWQNHECGRKTFSGTDFCEEHVAFLCIICGTEAVKECSNTCNSGDYVACGGKFCKSCVDNCQNIKVIKDGIYWYREGRPYEKENSSEARMIRMEALYCAFSEEGERLMDLHRKTKKVNAMQHMYSLDDQLTESVVFKK